MVIGRLCDRRMVVLRGSRTSLQLFLSLPPPSRAFPTHLKTCTKCREAKPLGEFPSNGPGKYRSACKACERLRDRARYVPKPLPPREPKPPKPPKPPRPPAKSAHPLWPRYANMLGRCHDPRHHAYPNYGGRGIAVCDAWRNDFWAYVAFWVEVPFPGASMERIDVNGHYEPSNCTWATPTQQARNKRNTRHVQMPDGRRVSLAEVADANNLSRTTLSDRLSRSGRSLADALTLGNSTQLRTAVEIDGERRSMAAWARHYGIPYDVFRARIKRGMDPKEAGSLPPGVHVSKLVQHNGEQLPLKDWARRLGIRYSTLDSRLRAGWPVGRAFATTEALFLPPASQITTLFKDP